MSVSFEKVFSESFNTFKAFKDLEPEEVGEKLEKSPNTIWQTLNHLILWQAHQLQVLSRPGGDLQFQESGTWVKEKEPKSQHELDMAVETFHLQIGQFTSALGDLTTDDADLEQKLTVIQEAANHLAFHLGEVIHLRRLLGNYPLPGQMSEFLKN